MEAAVFVFITWLAMGNEINKANDIIKIMEADMYEMTVFQQQQIDENIRQQEAINDLITGLEKLENKVEELEDQHEADFIKLATQHAAGYARHETMLSQQKLDLELMELKTDSLLEQMAIIREGVGSD